MENRIGTTCRKATVVLVMLLVPALSWAQSKPTCHGLTLPQKSKKASDDKANTECRYISSLNWDETLKFFSRNLPSGTKWHREVNIPAAKYVHVENNNAKSAWEGVNIYQVGGVSGEIRMYVIPRPVDPKKAAEKAAKEDKKGKKKVKKKKSK